MRILGIDPGDRRVGLAVSDELGITAQGLETFDKKSGVDFFDAIMDLVRRYNITAIVVGHPLHMSGESGLSGEKAEKLAEELQERVGIQAILWDERLSSVEAKRVLRGSRAKKGTADRLAAVIILQSYLDFLGGSAKLGKE